MPELESDQQPAFERLQGLLLTLSDVDTFLTELAQLATTAVPTQGQSAEPPKSETAADGLLACGITLRYDGI